MQLLGSAFLLCHMHGCFEGLDETFSQAVRSWVVGATVNVRNSVRCQVLPQFFCNELWAIVQCQ